jgi:hypothetical protein
MVVCMPSNNLQNCLSLSNPDATWTATQCVIQVQSIIIINCQSTSQPTINYQLSMKGSDTGTPSNGSSSPASSQTCVELSSSIHKDKASDKSSHVSDFFSNPSTIHTIPSSPPQESKMSTILPQEMKIRSPVRSPTNRFQPYYLKTRATAAATADFAMKSLRGQTAKELNPQGALMASHSWQCELINS